MFKYLVILMILSNPSFGHENKINKECNSYAIKKVVEVNRLKPIIKQLGRIYSEHYQECLKKGKILYVNNQPVKLLGKD